MRNAGRNACRLFQLCLSLDSTIDFWHVFWNKKDNQPNTFANFRKKALDGIQSSVFKLLHFTTSVNSHSKLTALFDQSFAKLSMRIARFSAVSWVFGIRLLT